MPVELVRIRVFRKYLGIVLCFVVISFLFLAAFILLNHDVLRTKNAEMDSSSSTSFQYSSSFGSITEEFRCSGVCYCEPDDRRVISQATGRSLVFVVSAITSVVAHKIAQERIHEKCTDSMSESCDDDFSLTSSIDECEHILEENTWNNNERGVMYSDDDSEDDDDVSGQGELRTKKLQRLESQKKNIVLVSCGSFNPITMAHLRLCETARDVLREDYDVNSIGAYISPVNDAYWKKGLVKAHHRAKMVDKAVESSDWIELDDWESKQDQWIQTRKCLARFERLLREDPKYKDVQVSLLMGTDMFETLPTPIWDPEDVDYILKNHEVVVMEREGADLKKILEENEILEKNQEHIHFIPSLIKNDISASKIRKLVKKGFSTKYLIQDCVREYIDENDLYSD